MIKQYTDQAAQKQKSARGLLGHLLLGPRPDSQWPGRRIGPPRRPSLSLLGRIRPDRRRGAFSTVGSDPTAVRLYRGIKTPRRRSPSKP